MVESKDNKIKELVISEIINDINELPVVYLKTLYSIVHTFKENILTVQRNEFSKNQETKDEESDFDWDSLIDEIHTNRKKNNLLINNRLSQLFAD